MVGVVELCVVWGVRQQAGHLCHSWCHPPSASVSGLNFKIFFLHKQARLVVPARLHVYTCIRADGVPGTGANTAASLTYTRSFYLQSWSQICLIKVFNVHSVCRYDWRK